jgi:hypothetical protein
LLVGQHQQRLAARRIGRQLPGQIIRRAYTLVVDNSVDPG